MKKHAIIPIFIPHRGCGNSCVFCNQRAITARESDITPQGARQVIESYLPTLKNRNLNEIEVSFFGGSFTGIPIEEQSAFLAVAKEFKDKGFIDKIHLSTRPDYINKEILDNLKRHSVDVIELGVQSFDQSVLDASRRGHSESCVYDACTLIKEYGFTLGIQLMIGLPGDSYEACMESVRKTIAIAPSLARIYPTVVISGTVLADMYKTGIYKPFDQAQLLKTAVDMYKALTAAGIYVMRVGLKATSLINNESELVLCGYHPAIGQIVEGSIARKKIEEQLKIFDACIVRHADDTCTRRKIVISAPEEILNAAVGHKACNKKYFEEKYPQLGFKYVKDNSIDPHSDPKDPFDCIKVSLMSKVYVSKKANRQLVSYLKEKDLDICFVNADAGAAKPIACHPDIHMCSLRSFSEGNIKQDVFFGDAKALTPEYPGDVLYNAARVGKYFLCSKYTDEKLIEKAKNIPDGSGKNGLEIIMVRQGYVKCSLVVIDDDHVITEDEGIAKTLKERTDIECLLVAPKQVSLPGYEYGFIGGASGRVGDEIIFNGNLCVHPDFSKIEDFIKKCGLKIKYFEAYPLTDIGSIIW